MIFRLSWISLLHCVDSMQLYEALFDLTNIINSWFWKYSPIFLFSIQPHLWPYWPVLGFFGGWDQVQKLLCSLKDISLVYNYPFCVHLLTLIIEYFPFHIWSMVLNAHSRQTCINCNPVRASVFVHSLMASQFIYSFQIDFAHLLHSF